jgi:truncated hemoglobin YjbI
MTTDRLSLSKPELKRLYQHLGGDGGGEAKLQAILRDFYTRMSSDTMLGFFFEGRDLHAIADKQAGFLLRAMGARASYAGKPPAQAHTALPPILAGHFDRRLRILEATLMDHGVSAEDIRTWVSFEQAFRDGIVRS